MSISMETVRPLCKWIQTLDPEKCVIRASIGTCAWVGFVCVTPCSKEERCGGSYHSRHDLCAHSQLSIDSAAADLV